LRVFSDTHKLFFLIFLLMPFDLGAEEAAWKPIEGAELIGTKAPALTGPTWLNSEPVQIDDLNGRVVLMRFWLVGCPFCENTAPSLVELHEKYKNRGLIIIGIHHPKSERTMDTGLVMKVARKFGYDFPIAQDEGWEVINRYWLGGKNRTYTSSTFLIDKEGVIRLVHDGGEFYKSKDNPAADSAYRAIDGKIGELLSE
ncbi:MAG: redoxin domain-containing protein, partial [Pirellulales bacterium]|nr:redoxin domain-containing protein [Pirellulales bacterium]